MTKRALRRLSVLQNEAAATPVPTRKFFHIGQPEMMDDVGECIPMIAWVDDNLSRFVVATAPSSSWGRDAAAETLVMSLPNVAVKNGEGVFVVTGAGKDESLPHPGGKGRMHFVHLGLATPLFATGLTNFYVYRLDGVQLKGMAAKA